MQVLAGKAAPGLSAYQIAVNRGFQGTEAQWLATLVGPKGDVGPASTVHGPKGDKGDKGDQGAQGLQGLAGIKGDTGPQGPKGDTGSQGIQGPKGDQGIQGVKGDTGPPGPGMVRTVRKLSAAHVNSTTTSTTIADWSHPVVAGKTYRFEVVGSYQTAALTTGARLSILPTTAVGVVHGMAWGAVAQAAGATGLEASLFAVATSTTVWPVGSTILTTGVSPINSPHHIGMDFIYVCTTSGQLAIQFASEVAASAAQMNAHSTLIVEELI
jgi:hypothetical protein